MAAVKHPELYLLHRMPKVGGGVHMPSEQLGLYLHHAVQALEAGFDGVALPGGVDGSESHCLDAFALAAHLCSTSSKGRIAVLDISLAVHGVLDVQRRAGVLAAVAPGRVELGLSLGRPRDFWASNVGAGAARGNFVHVFDACLFALGVADRTETLSVDPAYRSLQACPEVESLPVFVSGTYCAENRQMIARHGLPWLSYGDPMDEQLAGHAGQGRTLVVQVNLVDAEVPVAQPMADDRLFSARGAPPAYYGAEEFRRRLTSAAPAVISGSSDKVATEALAAASAANASRLVVDPWIARMDAGALQGNFAKAIDGLLPALRSQSGTNR